MTRDSIPKILRLTIRANRGAVGWPPQIRMSSGTSTRGSRGRGCTGGARSATRQRVAAVIVASTALTAFGLPAQVAQASGHHGKIRVRLLAGHQEIREVKVCATAKAAPANSTIGGKCHVTNAHGYATLTGVPAGRWYITLYKLSSPVRSSPHKIKVHAGRTATYTYHE